MSKNLKIEIRPVFRVHLAVPNHVTFGYLAGMINTHRGDIARQPARRSADTSTTWSLAVDFDDPAHRLDFVTEVSSDASEMGFLSESQIFVPTTCRS